jgi:hypothetical protein
MLLGLTIFRQISLIIMSHTNMLLLGLIIVWAWPQWRRSRRWPWLAAIGFFSGWAAITRPIDAMAWVAPVGVALLYDLRRESWRAMITRLAIVVAASLPLFALQIVFNIGVTGNPFRTPYAAYLDRFSPQSLWGVGGREIARPDTTLQQKLDYYDDFTAPAMREHELRKMPGIWLKERFPQMAYIMLPSVLLLTLVPLGVAQARHNVDWLVLAAPPALFVALYSTFAYLLPHYIVVHAAGVIFLALLGRRRLIATWPNGFLTCASALLIIAFSLPAFAELNWEMRDDLFVRPIMQFNYVQLPKLVKEPAIVLYRYRTGDNVHEEPVYNVDVVNPEDAPIIRAHDLGVQRDLELFKYYAQRQPQRTVYLVERHLVVERRTSPIAELGNVAELVRRLSATTPATTPATTQR